MLIHQLILATVLLAIIFFRQSQFRIPLIGLYFLICTFYYFNLESNIGMYGLIIFLILLMTGVIRNDEAFEDCCDHEHFEAAAAAKPKNEDDDDEIGIEQFGIEDKFTTLHNLIHELSNKK